MTKVIRILCVLVGAFFIFSGFVKAIDPLGFSYKLEEYFDVFADDTKSIGFISAFFLFLKNFSLYLSMFFCVLEMGLGVMLMFAIQMEITAWLLLLLIVFFTWLTGYSAITGKVTECGCFGDFFHLTAWASFNKDVVLLVLILLIFAFRHKIKPGFGTGITTLIMFLAFGGFAWLTVYCYNHLPIIDFRAYKVGNNIREQMTLPPGAAPDQYMSVLTYKDKATGKAADYVMSTDSSQSKVLKEKNIEPLPWQDTVWMKNHEFVSTTNKLVVKGVQPKITDFHVWDNENNDMTSRVLDDPNYHFWLVAYSMTETERESYEKINQLALAAQKSNIQFVGLTATPYEQLDPIRHELNAPFPFYYADGTVLKTIIRSNPGLLLLKGPTVVAMWHYHDIPSYDQISAKYFK